jgi:hypothetical protein
MQGAGDAGSQTPPPVTSSVPPAAGHPFASWPSQPPTVPGSVPPFGVVSGTYPPRPMGGDREPVDLDPEDDALRPSLFTRIKRLFGRPRR